MLLPSLTRPDINRHIIRQFRCSIVSCWFPGNNGPICVVKPAPKIEQIECVWRSRLPTIRLLCFCHWLFALGPFRFMLNVQKVQNLSCRIPKISNLPWLICRPNGAKAPKLYTPPVFAGESYPTSTSRLILDILPFSPLRLWARFVNLFSIGFETNLP